jgi:pimeloyl-ACP methyl ester carboxylesterase
MDDIGKALAFARGVRLITDASLAKMTLAGFSRGGQLAYAYASAEAAKPAPLRHLKGIVPLDVYLKTAPEDSDIRDFYCSIAPQEYELVAEGVTDSDNSLQIGLGANFLADPVAPTPFTDIFPPGFTNRQAFLAIAARTFRFFPATPFYHLNAASFGADGRPAALTESDETVIADWFAGSPFHEAFLEAADTDSLVCDQPPFAADVPLSRIRVPLLLIAAAGGYGAHALYTTTLVSSTDVSTILIQRKPDDEIAEDFGHGDILFARDAPQLAWQPLLSWLRAHE